LSHLDSPDTLRWRIVRYVGEHPKTSISELARNLQYPIASIRDKLNIAARHGHVKGESKRVVLPSGQIVLQHSYEILEEGRKWLQVVAQS
jgi:DeoR/GlpR family transcriptional regulator of sugar metabolism